MGITETPLYSAHRGMKVVRNVKNGAVVVYLHYSADPDKTDEWARKERATYTSMSDWNREYEIDFSAMTGLPVYPGFNRTIHLGKLQYASYQTIWRGWDFGYGHPACVWMQVHRDTGQLNILREYMQLNRTIDVFCDEVLKISNKEFPSARFLDAGDPAARFRNDKTEKNSADILRTKGAHLQTKKTLVKDGVNLIRRLLLTDADGRPKLRVDETRCPILVKGFSGGYVLDDQDDPEPVKDGFFDHVQDAVRYPVTIIFDLITASVAGKRPVIRTHMPSGNRTGY